MMDELPMTKSAMTAELARIREGATDPEIRDLLASMGLSDAVLSIRDLRRHLNVSAEALARGAHYSGGRSYIARLENGRGKMTERYVVAACSYLSQVERVSCRTHDLE